MSLRARLLLAISVVLAFTFLVFGVMVNRTLEKGLMAEVEGELGTWANAMSYNVEQSWSSATGLDERRMASMLTEKLLGRPILVQVALVGKGIVFRSQTLGTASLPVSTDEMGTSFATVKDGDVDWRCICVPVLEGGRCVA